MKYDAQVQASHGEWVSIYGPFDDRDDAEDVVAMAIKKGANPQDLRVVEMEET